MDYSSCNIENTFETERLSKDLLIHPVNSPMNSEGNAVSSPVTYSKDVETSLSTKNLGESSWGAPRMRYEELLDTLQIELRHEDDGIYDDSDFEGPEDDPEDLPMNLIRMMSDNEKFKFCGMLDNIQGREEFGHLANQLSVGMRLRDPSVFDT